MFLIDMFLIDMFLIDMFLIKNVFCIDHDKSVFA